MNTVPKQRFTINRVGVTPVASGVNTDWDRAQLQLGQYSVADNVRMHGPGFRLRPGLNRHHTDDLGEVYSIFSYRKGESLFAQLSNGDVYEATDNPPATTVGAFGSIVLDESSINNNSSGTVLNGSWNTIRENIIFSEGKIQHTIRPGTLAKPLSVNFLAATSLTRILEGGTDITFDVIDPDSENESADLLFTVANEDALYICCEFPANKWTFDLEDVVSGTGSFTFQFHDGDGFVTQSTGLTDGTSGWTQDGLFEATYAGRDSAGTERPTVNFGVSGYWYRWELGSTNATETISFNSISYDGDFRLIENVMEADPDFIIESQVENATGEFETYAAGSISLKSLAIGDYLYFATTDPAWAFYFEVGSTPNTTASTAIDDFDVWDGSQFSPLTNVEDGTGGLANTGFISVDRSSPVPRKRAFNSSKYNAYWYRINWDKAMSDDVIVALSALYSYDINDFGRAGKVSTSWKERGCYTFSILPRDIYVSKLGRPNVLNGNDFAILSPGDGRYNDVTAMLSFHNELMVFQEEEGSLGGCITLFEGYSPETFGRLVLSTRLGTFSQSSVCIIDGTDTVTRTTDVTQIIVAFISKYGIFMTDGRTIRRISHQIDNIFDQEKDEYINASSKSSHWISYDRANNCLRVGIETIQGSGVANIFPVYNLDLGEWTYDTYTDHSPTAFAEVTAESGNIDSLQYLAAVSPGGTDLIYRCVAGQIYDEESDGTEVAVEGKIRMEFSNGGNYLNISEIVLRSEAQEDFTLTKKVYENGILDSEETETFTMVDEEDSSRDVYRERILEGLQYNHHFSIEISWKDTESNWGNNPVIYDFVHEINSSPNIN